VYESHDIKQYVVKAKGEGKVREDVEGGEGGGVGDWREEDTEGMAGSSSGLKVPCSY